MVSDEEKRGVKCNAGMRDMGVGKWGFKEMGE